MIETMYLTLRKWARTRPGNTGRNQAEWNWRTSHDTPWWNGYGSWWMKPACSVKFYFSCFIFMCVHHRSSQCTLLRKVYSLITTFSRFLRFTHLRIAIIQHYLAISWDKSTAYPWYRVPRAKMLLVATNHGIATQCDAQCTHLHHAVIESHWYTVPSIWICLFLDNRTAIIATYTGHPKTTPTTPHIHNFWNAQHSMPTRNRAS